LLDSRRYRIVASLPRHKVSRNREKVKKLLRFRTGLLAGCFPVVKENRTTAFVSGGF